MSHNLKVTAILQRNRVLSPSLLIMVSSSRFVRSGVSELRAAAHQECFFGGNRAGNCSVYGLERLMEFPPQRKSSGWKSVAPCSQSFQSFFSFKLHPILDFSGLMSEMTICPLRRWLWDNVKLQKNKQKKYFFKCLMALHSNF